MNGVVNGNCQELIRICLNLKLGILILLCLFFRLPTHSSKFYSNKRQTPSSCSVPIPSTLRLVSFCAGSDRCNNNFVGQTSASSPAIIWRLHLLPRVSHKRTGWHVFNMHRHKNNNPLLKWQKGFMVYLSFLSKVLKKCCYIVLSVLPPMAPSSPARDESLI